MKITVSGKGGSGKSTLSVLLARAFNENGSKVLLVDADESNFGLCNLLGVVPPVNLMDTFGGKKGFKKKLNQPLSLDGNALFAEKQRIDDLPAQCLAEADGIKLLAIGKIHHFGEGCACPMGVLSKKFLAGLELETNDVVIIDTEAGVEHFGRGVDSSIDAILIAVEPSYESMAIARRIKEISSGMRKPFWAVLNKVKSNAVATKLKTDLKKSSIEVIGVIPDDPLIFEASFEGRPFMAGAATRAARGILDFLLSLE